MAKTAAMAPRVNPLVWRLRLLRLSNPALKKQNKEYSITGTNKIPVAEKKII
jgi:hypothetical protein